MAPKILVCPLNWGLGHATRCIPLIDQFLAQGFEVHIASDGQALQLLRGHYPLLNFLELPSYNIVYPSEGNMAWKLLLQVPKLVKAVYLEHRKIQEWAQQNPGSILLSDNRFGCFSHQLYSLYLTHQIQIMPPKGMEFLKLISYPIHKLVFAFYNEIWIPDHPRIQLAGKLSQHSSKLKYKAIGLLSRFKAQPTSPAAPVDLSIVLSGPEPQRTLLENQLLEQLPYWLGSGKNATLVRGMPSSELPVQIPGLQVYAHLPSEELQVLMQNSKRILCRAGYSTLMDLSEIQAKAIIIPTPGQTEQEYLARRAHELGWAPALEQDQIDLSQLPDLEQWRGFMQPSCGLALLEQEILRLKKTLYDSN